MLRLGEVQRRNEGGWVGGFVEEDDEYVCLCVCG